MAERESWHLSKGVPITLIIAILIQTSAIVWWAASMQSNVEVNSRSINANGSGIEKLETRIETMRADSARRDVQFGRIEANQQAMKASLGKVERALEKLTP